LICAAEWSKIQRSAEKTKSGGNPSEGIYMAFDIVTLSVVSSILTTILTNLLIWLNRVFLLKLLRDTLRWSRRVWGRLVFAKFPRLIIRTARAAALKFCLQAIPDSKDTARNIKRKEIMSAFSHYRNNATWIEALIKAGEFMGGGDVGYSGSEGDIPTDIRFSNEELIPGLGHVGPTCCVYIKRDKTYWIYTEQNLPNSLIQGDVVKAEIRATLEIPGLSEFIELLECVGLKKTEFYDILKSFQP